MKKLLLIAVMALFVLGCGNSEQSSKSSTPQNHEISEETPRFSPTISTNSSMVSLGETLEIDVVSLSLYTFAFKGRLWMPASLDRSQWESNEVSAAARRLPVDGTADVPRRAGAAAGS